MSKGDRDQRGRPHSTKRCPESMNGGCLWCHTGDQKPLLRRRARRAATRDVNDRTNDLSPAADEDFAPLGIDSHTYLGERCVRCNVNIYDAGIYGPADCPARDYDYAISYSTTTGTTATSSHPAFLGSDEQHPLNPATQSPGLPQEGSQA